jgi:mono/diheme cytochrome c family protein
MGPLERAGFCVAAACGTLLLWVVPVKVAETAAAVPTFNKDVAPILFANCVSCHRPGEVAPMSLLSYENARPWARAIKAKVLAREMPPWPPDPQYGQFQNAPTLGDAQIDTLVAWVDAGAPQGDGDPPPRPTFIEGWTSKMGRPPDQVIVAPFEFELPASGEIPVFTVWAKLPFRQEKFVEAIELRPANRALVHHATVFLGKLPLRAQLGKGEVWPGGPVVDGVPVLRDGTLAPLPPAIESFAKPLVFYVPAGGSLRLPEGVGKRISPDEYLMWNFHLVTSGKVEQTTARIGLWFSRSDVRHEALTRTVTDRILANGHEVSRDATGPHFPNIAPHDSQYIITGLTKVKEDLTLYALWPHMHVRGRDMKFILVDPKGREQTLLSVPRYNFLWQFRYELTTPLKIRAGSTIKAIAHYDNSSANRYNPDPNQEVVWGPQTTNEMFNPFLELVYDKRPVQPALGFPSDCGRLPPPFGPTAPDQPLEPIAPQCR